MKGGKWDLRIRRAKHLASVHSFASQGLHFYERITQFQKFLYAEIETICGTAKKTRPSGTPRHDLDERLLLPQFAPFLSLVEQNAPASLSQSAHELRSQDVGRWRQILREFWEEGSDSPVSLEPAEELISWIFLQPYAEYLTDYTEQVSVDGTPSRCPLCAGKPQVGALRREGDGAKRSLICALCAHEWNYRRIVCHSCGEEDVHKLEIYTAQDFSHVRVEACVSCHHYIKTVDLTKDGHAVPVVDELATIPLNLWAVEHGYRKSQTNLLGI
jgi:formate dehydrogenase accessory protein FdhE